jgi:hypothetical protein
METAHKNVKSYLLSGTSNLYHLHTAMVSIINQKEQDYLQNAARMQMRQRQRFIGQSWLGNITLTVSYHAIDLLAQQYRLAVASIPSRFNPQPEELKPCTSNFTQQYGLPCAHTIYHKLEEKEALCQEDVHPRWWLEKPLV